MTNIAGSILVACAGCSSLGPPSATTADASLPTPPPPDSGALTPGVYATIIGGDFAGTYALTQTVQCNVDVETGAYRIFGGDVHHDLSLFARTKPEAGHTDSSPDFWMIVSDDDDQGVAYYPQDTGGSCVVMVDASWPVARARFSCTGGAFAISDGVAICPAM